VHLNLVGPLWTVSRQSGRASTSLAAFTGGTIAGELIRITLVAAEVGLVLEVIRHPTLLHWVGFILLSGALLVAFRWSSHRFLPTYGLSSRRPGSAFRLRARRRVS
jgi:hypothetical protein